MPNFRNSGLDIIFHLIYNKNSYKIDVTKLCKIFKKLGKQFKKKT